MRRSTDLRRPGAVLVLAALIAGPAMPPLSGQLAKAAEPARAAEPAQAGLAGPVITAGAIRSAANHGLCLDNTQGRNPDCHQQIAINVGPCGHPATPGQSARWPTGCVLGRVIGTKHGRSTAMC